MHIEACTHCDTLDTMIKSVRAAQEGGAARLELCADMAVDGLTPAPEYIRAARQNFDRPGVLVMIRPRGGDFYYSDSELNLMLDQISLAAECGADGIVCGALTRTNELDVSAMSKLIEQSKEYDLQITFHRAFDATPNPFETLDKLIELGVDRILTSGTTWGDARGAVDGINRLNQFIEHAGGRMEIVIGGGVSVQNAPVIVSQLTTQHTGVSLHAYSGIRKDGATNATLVRELVSAAQRT